METNTTPAARPLNCCPCCGDDWDYSAVSEAHWMLDVRTSGTDCWAELHPCCQGMADELEAHGYELATGRTVASVVRELTGRDVLAVEEDGTGTVVCRLRTVDPTQVLAATDAHGNRKAKSPKGWQTEVFADVDENHRHHPAPQGWKFGVAVYNGGVKVGVATVGRPVSRVLQAAQPHTLEVTRVCTWGPAPLRKNVVSKLYAAAAERARSMGYRKLITYTIHHVENGRSLQASGWVSCNVSDGGSWKCEARPDASEAAPTNQKVRWERGLSKSAGKAVRRTAVALPAAAPVDHAALATTAAQGWTDDQLLTAIDGHSAYLPHAGKAERAQLLAEGRAWAAVYRARTAHLLAAVAQGGELLLTDLLAAGAPARWAQPSSWDRTGAAWCAAQAMGLQVVRFNRRHSVVLASK